MGLWPRKMGAVRVDWFLDFCERRGEIACDSRQNSFLSWTCKDDENRLTSYDAQLS